MAAGGGISFRELMVGGFAFHETDPISGERVGARDGTILAMHATAAIPNLVRFVNDPEHTGQLCGSVSFPPLCTGTLAGAGEFRLFVRTPDPVCKAMVYILKFCHEGREYCLMGSKRVLKRSVVHSWQDTTTLFCQLHAGCDQSAPIIGAGVLHLKAAEFIRQLFSFRTLNATSIRVKAGALAGFGTFFGRELWDTYFG